jgi:hypothetical protein
MLVDFLIMYTYNIELESITNWHQLPIAFKEGYIGITSACTRSRRQNRPRAVAPL